MKLIMCTILVVFLLPSCGSKKYVTPEEAEGKQLILSHGGGFTGKYKTYYLLENGQLFKNAQGVGGTYGVENFEKKIVKQIFSNYITLGLENMDVKTYGNLTYSITMKDKDKEHKLQWEKGQKGTEALQLFYRNIMNLIKISNDDSGNNKPNNNEKN